MAVGAHHGGAGVGAHLFLLVAQLVGIAELQDQLVGTAADVLLHVVAGAPGALPHGQALIQGLGPVLLAGVVVILGVPDAVAEILQAVPGEPPLEHLGGDAGHLGLVGQIAGAVGHDAPADLAGQVAGPEQLVAVLNLQGQSGVDGAALQDGNLLRRDGGDGQIVELGIGQGALFRGQDGSLAHNSTLLFHSD